MLVDVSSCLKRLSLEVDGTLTCGVFSLPQLFVAFVVLAGIGIVLGIPYMVFVKKGKKSKAYSLLNHSRKQMAGKL